MRRDAIFLLMAVLAVAVGCSTATVTPSPAMSPTPQSISSPTPPVARATTAASSFNDTVTPTAGPPPTPSETLWALACVWRPDPIEHQNGVRIVFILPDASGPTESQVRIADKGQESRAILDRDGRLVSEQYKDNGGRERIRQVMDDEVLMREVREKASRLPAPYENLPVLRQPQGPGIRDYFIVEQTLQELVDTSELVVAGVVQASDKGSTMLDSPRGFQIPMDRFVHRVDVSSVLKGHLESEQALIGWQDPTMLVLPGTTIVAFVQVARVPGPETGYVVSPQRLYLVHEGRMVPFGPVGVETTDCYRDMPFDAFVASVQRIT